MVILSLFAAADTIICLPLAAIERKQRLQHPLKSARVRCQPAITWAEYFCGIATSTAPPDTSGRRATRALCRQRKRDVSTVLHRVTRASLSTEQIVTSERNLLLLFLRYRPPFALSRYCEEKSSVGYRCGMILD